MSEGADASPKRSRRLADFLASTVVFLVALPLCIGIAVACGVPAERGLITGILGGIVVGFFSGAPLLVSGPAASLIVPVVDLIRDHGIAALAPVVMLAGVWQALAGVLRLGVWFRAVAPAVISGMLIGIGVLIFASQLHVCVDVDPQKTFVDNVLALPASVLHGRPGHGGFAPLLISSSTILIIVFWDRIRPRALKLVPGQLLALVFVTGAAALASVNVKYLDISPSFFDALQVTSTSDVAMLKNFELIGLSFVFAFVASAATLLTASAIDQMQTRTKTNYDREMIAQGVGNLLTGVVGGLPMTGVIVRSSVNVDAGAQTRLSTILHGIWIVLFVSAAPQVLELIPQASLGAILVYTGYRLIDGKVFVTLYRQGRLELGICLVTLFGVVFIDLFIGIIAGLAAAVAKIVYTFARLDVRSEPRVGADVQDLHLKGSATFLQLPYLASALDEVPVNRELHVHIDGLDHIDQACLQLLSTWSNRRESEGHPGMVVEWDELTNRYRNALVGTGQAPTGSLMSMVWQEWKQIYAPGKGQTPAASADPWEDFIDAKRTRVQLDAHSLDDVVLAAAQSLAPLAGVSTEALTATLRERVEGHVALGGGISVPHAPVAGLERSLAALVTTKRPVDVAGEEADLFFVLLAPEADPRAHLRTLAHVGRLCHDEGLLKGLREATTSEAAVRTLRAFDAAVLDTGTGFQLDTRVLAVVDALTPDRARNVGRLVREAFGNAAVGTSTENVAFDVVRRVLRLSRGTQLIVVALDEPDVQVLHTLLREEQRVASQELCPTYLLRGDVVARDPEAPMEPDQNAQPSG